MLFHGLKLECPLVFFDLETTGTNVATDRIVEIGMVKVYPNGDRETRSRRINPEMKIPEEASAVHGIRDEDVKDAPTFRSIAENLATYLKGCDLAGYNLISFDVPLLVAEFARCGVELEMEGRRVIDAFTIFKKMSPRNLAAAYRFYCGKTLENAHSAEADILATLEVLEGQLDMYLGQPGLTLPKGVDSFPENMDQLHDFCNRKPDDWIDSTGKFKWTGKRAIIGFGKNAGTSLEEISVNNPKFLTWLINADFPEDAKVIARQALKGEYPTR